MKKVIALLLVLLMLAGMLLSCKKQGGENGESNGGVEAPTGAVQTNASGYVLDRLPADLSMYNGKTVKLLGWDGQSHQTIPKDDSADDPIQSTLYQHWRGIEDRFGITFNTIYTDSEWVARDTFITAAISDQGNYDLIQTQTLFPILLAEQGKLCNLKNLSYPDLAKDEDGNTAMPWWPTSVDEYSQHGALYFIGSNSSAMTISQMSVIFINTKLISGKGLASPVTSVIRGSWTVAEMENIVKQFTAEAEGTAPSNRIYGLAIDCEDRNARLYYACGFRSIVNNADGVGQLAYNDETELLAITNALDSFKGIFVDNAAAVIMHDNDTTTELDQGRAALFLGYMEYIRTLQDVESWTVVPLPKLNFEQPNYVTTFRDWADLWCMPTTTQDVVLSGMLLEANACSEYNMVAPFYFEQYLKDRYSSSVEGRQCFDILRETMLYDLGVAATISGLGAEQTWRACFRGSFNNNFAETIKGQRDSLQDTLNRLLLNFEKYKNNGLPA